MKTYSLNEIRKTQKGKGFWLKISNEIASLFIYKIQSLQVHPNWFTFISLLFGVLFAFLLLNNHLWLAALSVNILYLFDNVDGQWARIKKMTSTFGAIFDSLVDGWNISIVVFSIGIYLFHQTSELLYLYLMSIFFVLSFLDFALEKNNFSEIPNVQEEIISLQERSSRLKPIIVFVDRFIMYDKWILVITLGLLFDFLYVALYYVVFVRLLNYIVKLLKLYLKFR